MPALAPKAERQPRWRHLYLFSYHDLSKSAPPLSITLSPSSSPQPIGWAEELRSLVRLACSQALFPAYTPCLESHLNTQPLSNKQR